MSLRQESEERHTSPMDLAFFPKAHEIGMNNYTHLHTHEKDLLGAIGRYERGSWPYYWSNVRYEWSISGIATRTEQRRYERGQQPTC